MRNRLVAELLAEFLGTMVLILFGAGVVATVVLFGKGVPGEVANGGTTNINICWGLGVTMGIYIAGKTTGAHLNPAVTLTLAVFRGFPWAKVAPYALAQTAGAFVAAGLVFLNYRPAFQKADPLLDHTAGVFSTFPSFPGDPAAGWIDQIIGTALLLLLILAITDEDNQWPGSNLTPVLVGAVVVAIGMAFGPMHGYAINPARDFGPRLFTLVAGFKNTGFDNGVFWVPLLAPLMGGLLGGAVYDYAVKPCFPPKEGVGK
jgi:glycerol uptake facilitator protein